MQRTSPEGNREEVADMTNSTKGQSSVGPSKAYLRLLRGETSAKSYADRVKKSIDRQIGAGGRASAGGSKTR